MGITPNGLRDFSGIRMKVRLEGAGAMGILRCPTDNETLLTFNEDDITLKDCQHFRWHGGPDEDEIVENKEDENEEEDEESWNEVLKQNYIAKVSVGDAAFYLIRLEKAVEK